MKLLTDTDLQSVVGGIGLVATVGINSPNGSKMVTAPASAVGGLINAFTQVSTKGPGELTNIDITIVP
jgi:bacteriocin-like protein